MAERTLFERNDYYQEDDVEIEARIEFPFVIRCVDDVLTTHSAAYWMGVFGSRK